VATQAFKAAAVTRRNAVDRAVVLIAGVLRHNSGSAMRSISAVVRLTLLLVGASCCGGCVAVSTIVVINGNGSGMIYQRVLLTPAALTYMRGRGAGSAAGDLVPEATVRQQAATFGRGVTFVASTAIESRDGVGRDATYAVADLTQLRLPALPVLDGLVDRPPEAGTAVITFSLQRQPGGNMVVGVHVPLPDLPPWALLQNGGSRTGTSADQIAVLRQTFAGGALRLAIDPAGRVIRASGPHRDGNRIVIADVSADALLADRVTLERLAEARSVDDLNAALPGGPGERISFDPLVTIEFAPTP
jgi:hypothetical protein